jgi:hypothetical protein
MAYSMKITGISSLLLILSSPLFAAPLPSSPPPTRAVLEFRFNEPHGDAVSSGLSATRLQLMNSRSEIADLRCPGVSGKAGDLAFDNSKSTGMGSGGLGGSAVGLFSSAGSHALDLKSFTIQGWVQAAGAIANGARIVDFSSNGQGICLCGSLDAGVLQIYVNGANANSASPAYGKFGEWMFFAVSYDSASGEASFYIGSADEPVKAVTSRSLKAGEVILPNEEKLCVGNTLQGIRPFAGKIDDLRLFGSESDGSGALDVSELEHIRQLDLSNNP